MAPVSYHCPVDPECPHSPAPGFCGRHPTTKLERTRVAYAPPEPEPPASQDPAGSANPADGGGRAGSAALCLKLLGESVPVPPGGMVIGREDGPCADLPGMAELLQVSRRHARVQYQGAGLIVIDLDSVNHTYVNGREVVGSAELRPGDELRLGRDVLVEVGHLHLDQYGLPE